MSENNLENGINSASSENLGSSLESGIIDFGETSEIKTPEVVETPKKAENSKKSDEDLAKNIFSDFEVEKTLKEEVLEKTSKDIFFYLSILHKVLLTIFVLLAIGIGVLFYYIYIQTSNASEKSYLDPICSVFIGDIDYSGSCASINYVKSQLETEKADLLQAQYNSIKNILPSIYESENYLKTKEISFLLEKSTSRLKVLDAFAKFDYYRESFSGLEKKKLQCSNFKLEASSKTLAVECVAYSNGYTKDIIGESGTKQESDKVGGTSISIANSFLNYLEKNAKGDFVLVDRQKTFSTENVDESAYTNKTPFTIKLKLNF